MPLDETEAYLRHRARVHEREKREKLRRQGKLEAYLAEIEKNKPKIETKGTDERASIDNIMEKYKAVKLDKETVLSNLKLDNSLEECVDEIVARRKKVKKRRRKKAVVEEDSTILVDDDAEFRPNMAGSTGLPTFFFSNLVKQNQSVFIRARYTCRPKKE